MRGTSRAENRGCLGAEINGAIRDDTSPYLYRQCQNSHLTLDNSLIISPQDFFNDKVEIEAIEEGDAVVDASSYSPDFFTPPPPFPDPSPPPAAQGVTGSSNHGSSQGSYSRNRSHLAPKTPSHGASDVGDALSLQCVVDRDDFVVEGKKTASFTLPKGARGLLATPTSPHMARASDSFSKQVRQTV